MAKETGADYSALAMNQSMFPTQRPLSSVWDHGRKPITGLGRGQGTLPLYETAEAMNYAIDTYFDSLEPKVEGMPLRPPTLAGLALAIGFKSVSSLKNYEKKGEDFAYIIEVARTRIEMWKNEKLVMAEKQVHGIIFDLKNNHGWEDRTTKTIENTVGGSLADLLQSLQGSVLRPVLNHEDDAEDADFEELSEIDTEVDEFNSWIEDPFEEELDLSSATDKTTLKPVDLPDEYDDDLIL